MTQPDDEQPSDDPTDSSRLDDVKTTIENAATVAMDWSQSVADDVGPVLADAAGRARDRVSEVPWRQYGRTAAPYLTSAAKVILGLAAVYWVLQFMWGAFGPVSTIAYVVLFVIGAIGTPLFVILFGPSFPNLFKDLYGKLHWFLGALTFGNTIIVETDDGWDVCPARDGHIYIHGAWHEITGGLEHKSTILGLPFAIARDKTSDDTYANIRVDPHAQAVSDGGVVKSPNTGQRKRGDYDEASPDLDVSGVDGVWLVDLVRIMSSGLVHAGDGELVEQAEMDQLQDEAKSTRMQGWKPVIGMIAGLVLGCGVGFTIMFAM